MAALAPDGAVVEVGGVGLARPVHARHARRRCASASRPACRPSLVVREDSLTLYGFADDDERVVFELLQTASGVGPRLAQAMLAVHAPDALRRAVADRGPRALTQVPGIGRKGAQRIVLELKDRLGAVAAASRDGRRAGRPPVRAGWRDQLHGAAGSGSAGRRARPTRRVASAAPVRRGGHRRGRRARRRRALLQGRPCGR